MWVFPKIGEKHQNGRFIKENHIKIDDLGVPLFLETPMCFRFSLKDGFLQYPFHVRYSQISSGVKRTVVEDVHL